MTYAPPAFTAPTEVLKQLEITRRMRAQLDHEADRFRYFQPAKEDTMAKKTAKKARPRPKAPQGESAKAYAKRVDAEREASNVAAKERLAAAAEAAPKVPEGDAIGIFLAHYFLDACGVTVAEQCNLFYVENLSVMRDRIETGRYLARQRGLDQGGLAERSLAMRENQWAEGARIAASSMQERILLALPAFIRSAAGGVSSDGADRIINGVVDLVRSFHPSDVVQVSDAAKKFSDPTSGAVIGTTEQGNCRQDPRARPISDERMKRERCDRDAKVNHPGGDQPTTDPAY